MISQTPSPCNRLSPPHMVAVMPMTRHPPSPDLPDLIGTTQASRILNLSPATVARWAGDGTLTPVGRLGGRRGALIFDRTQVEELAATLTRHAG